MLNQCKLIQCTLINARSSIHAINTAGGSRSSTASILTRLHALAEAEQQLQHHTAALHQAQATLQAMAAAAASHNRYRHALGTTSNSKPQQSQLTLNLAEAAFTACSEASQPRFCAAH